MRRSDFQTTVIEKIPQGTIPPRLSREFSRAYGKVCEIVHSNPTDHRIMLTIKNQGHGRIRHRYFLIPDDELPAETAQEFFEKMVFITPTSICLAAGKKSEIPAKLKRRFPRQTLPKPKNKRAAASRAFQEAVSREEF